MPTVCLIHLCMPGLLLIQPFLFKICGYDIAQNKDALGPVSLSCLAEKIAYLVKQVTSQTFT